MNSAIFTSIHPPQQLWDYVHLIIEQVIITNLTISLNACICCNMRLILMTSWNTNIFRITDHLCGEFTGTQRPVTRSVGVSFYLRLDKRLSKQSWGWWFETPSRPLWSHRNVTCYTSYIKYGSRFNWIRTFRVDIQFPQDFIYKELSLWIKKLSSGLNHIAQNSTVAWFV